MNRKISQFGLKVFLGMVACGAIQTVALGQQCSININPVFEGLQGYGIDIPLDVTLENDDQDTRGIVMAANGSAVQIPVDLPHGGKKRVQILLEDSSYDFDYKVRYACGLGVVEDSYQPKFQYNGYYGPGLFRIALIGGESGDIKFLSDGSNFDARRGSALHYQDVYSTVERAPERSYLYSPIDVVVLGEGAERLNDNQVEALQSFLTTGGKIVFLGGASPQVALDPRWQSILPVEGLKVVNVNDPKVLKPISNTEAPPGAFTVSTGQIKSGADATIGPQDSILRAAWKVGSGTVIFFGVNPLEGSLRGWTGRKALVGNYLSAVSDWGEGRMGPKNQEGWRGSPGMMADANSPFRATLPRVGRILTILGLYFLVVIPVNFFVLKLLRRGELAWFTAPIISIFFAWIFYLNSAGIYDQPQSMMTMGTLVADERLPKAVYVGNAEMFFPSGGTFDLKLKEVESFRDMTSQNRGPFGQLSGTVVERLDVGHIIVPVVSLPSFSFREFRFSQSFPSEHMLVLKISGVKRVSPNSVKVIGSLMNQSKLELKDATLNLGTGLNLGSIKPGEKKDFSVDVRLKSRDGNDAPTHASPLITLRANIVNQRFGPEFGKVDLHRNQDFLEYTFNQKPPEVLQ